MDHLFGQKYAIFGLRPNNVDPYGLTKYLFGLNHHTLSDRRAQSSLGQKKKRAQSSDPKIKIRGQVEKLFYYLNGIWHFYQKKKKMAYGISVP